MDFISYRGLPMRIIRTVACEREHVTDDSRTTYLYTLWRGTVVATYSPGAITFQAGNPPTPNGGANNFGGPGSLPALTDNAIRQWLSQPRGQLIIQSLGNTVLSSPININGAPASCDARNGPFVRVNSIIEIAGERLWQIELQFEAAVIENPTPSIIISNRWSAEANVNWQHLTTRTYAGTVTVRSDFLLNSGPAVAGQPIAGVAPGQLDALRSAFCAFSIPNNFQRQHVDVRVEPDGLTAHYSVVDAEQLWNRNQNCPAVRIELQESSWRWSPHFLPRAVAQLSVVNNLPKYYRRVHCRVWGNARTDRRTLLNLGLGVCVVRVGSLSTLDPSVDEVLVSQDLNNSVDVVFTRSWDFPSLGLFGNAAFTVATWFQGANPGAQANQQFINGLYLDPTNISEPITGSTISTTASGPNPPFPNSSGTRGTYLGTLVTQILEGFNAAPGAPP